MGALLNLLPHINPVPHNSDTTAIAMRPDYVKFTKNGNAALMLSQLVYWYQVDKHGKAKITLNKEGVFWRKMDHHDWLNEIGLTRSQSRTATKRLIDLGVIEVKTFLYGRDKCQHYRLLCAEGQATLPGYPKFTAPLALVEPSIEPINGPADPPTNTPGVKDDQPLCQPSPHPVVKLAVTVAKVAQPFTDTVSDNVTDTVSDTENLPTAKAVGYGFLKTQVQIKENKEKQIGIKGFKKNFGEIFGEKIVNLQDVLKTMENKKNEEKPLDVLWNQKLSELTGVTSKPMTTLQKKMLKEVKRELGEENLANNKTIKTRDCINFVMSDWKKFGREVGRRKTLQKPPTSMPCVFFFRAHWDVAVQLIAQESSVTKAKVESLQPVQSNNVVPTYEKPVILPSTQGTGPSQGKEPSYKEKLKELYKL